MAAATQKPSSFNCEIRIIEAKNIEFKSPKNLFVRYYLSTDTNKKVRLNTTQVSSISDFIWNQSFCLECLGSQQSLHALQQATVVFELRRAKARSPVFRSSSQLLGRAEIPWSEVFESSDMGIERWVSMVCGDNNGCVYKQPKLKVGMRVRVPEEMGMNNKMKRNRKWKDECGCCESSKVGHFCGDFELFALAAAMEFL